MAQAEASPNVGSANNSIQQAPLKVEQRKASTEAITAAATAVVAEMMTTAHGEAERKQHTGSTPEATTLMTATSEVKGETTTPPDKEAEVSGGATDPQLGASPRPVRPGGDLRGSFLAAVGNTISLAVRRYWCCAVSVQPGRIICVVQRLCSGFLVFA